MKKLLFTLLTVITTLTVNAESVSKQEALLKAQLFMPNKQFKEAKAYARGEKTDSQSESCPFYIFNAENKGGFIIVSGDDRTQPILGYSNTGTFEYDNLPENAKAWMDGYAKQINTLDDQDKVAGTRGASPQLTKEVAPLLGEIAWYQMDPFNLLCPFNDKSGQHYLTGCGPTAMAQIMYYYRWPQGYAKGSKSYYDEGCHQTLSADFSKSKYDWDKMLPVYDSHYEYQDGKRVSVNDFTDEQANEVAKLMRDCGFAAGAHYDGDGTGSNGASICEALKTYFDYKQTTCYLSSYYYDKESWEDILRNELDNKRPVLYSAGIDVGGHLFVCDGYDKNGFFHFNWGWGGKNNGYYATSAMRGCDRGEIWCGIQRSIDTGKQIISPRADSDFKWSSGNKFSCSLAVWTSVNNIELAIAAENLTTGAVQYLSITPFSEVVSHDGTWVNELTLKGTLSNGNYKIYPVARASGQGWEKFHFYQLNNLQEYVLLTVSRGVKTFSNDVNKTKYLYNGVWYSLDKTTHEAKATRYIGSGINGRYTANSLTISSSFTYNGETYTVTAIDEDAFSNCTSLTSITIPSSVKEIGPSAFYQCTSLTNISLGNITTVGPYAFYGCTALASATFGNKITSIGHYAFYKCTSLESAILPSGLTAIEEYTFYKCSSLAEVVIPATVTSIGEFALYTESQKLRVKSLIKDPFSYAYQSIYPLEVLIVPDGTKEKYQATNYWNQFSTIMEESGMKVGDTFRVTDNNILIYCKITDINSRTVEITNFRPTKKLSEEVIVPTSIKGPDEKTYTVTAIGRSAMSGSNEKWTSIVIPNTVTTFGNYAFSYSPTLQTFAIPSSVTSIGEFAFLSCTALVSVTVKATTPISIPKSTFQNTTSLTTLYVPKGAETAYRNAPVWGDIANIVGIDMAAEDANKIITFADANVKAVCIKEWDTDGDGELSMAEAASVKSLDGAFSIPINSMTMPGYSRPLITSFNELQYFTGLTFLESGAFSKQYQLSSVIIPISVESIGASAFYGCSSLTSITIPSNVTSIGKTVFKGCNSLSSIVVESGNPTYNSPDNCNAIIETSTNTLIAGCKNTIIPNSVTSIGDYAFYGCSKLTSITIPNNVTSIGGSAFEECNSLTYVTIGSAVTSIDMRAFVCQSNELNVTSLIQDPLLVNVVDAFSPQTSLMVPIGTLNVYKSTYPWSLFSNIGILGDANGNNTVDEKDITAIVDYLMGKKPIPFYEDSADANGDGIINVADIVTIIKSK